jgi:sarcosine oxidase, subunit beta
VTDSAAVVVIGAGVTGLSSAYELTRQGITNVTVIDAEYVASGSSGRSIGLIETQYVKSLDIALRAISMAGFAELEREYGLRIVRNGYLRLTSDEAVLPGFEASVEVQREYGLTGARVLGPDEIMALVPDLSLDDIAGGLWGPQDGFVDGHLYATLLSELAVGAGAELRTKTRVQGLSSGDSRRYRLRTSRGDLECDFVVNAAGAWGEEVGVMLGVRLPLKPTRHQVVSLHLPATLDYMMPSVIDYVPGSGREGLYFRHETFEQLLVGLHSEETIGPSADPNSWFAGVDADYYETLSELLTRRLPRLSQARLGTGWAGLYPISPDGLPQVGPCPDAEGVIAACGVGGYGIQVAPLMGRLVAEWIANGEPEALAEYELLLPGRPGLSEGVAPG